MRTATEVELAWAAGLVEGEGCISLGSNRNVHGRKAGDNTTIQVVMSDEDIVRRLHEILGVGRVVGPYHPNGNVKWKQVWRLTIADQFDMHDVLVALRPWFGARRGAAADAAIALFSSRPRQKQNHRSRS